MALERTFEFGEDAGGPSRVELTLDGTAFTQRLLARDGTWSTQRSRFDTVAEAREALERMCTIYARRGTLVASAGETTAPARILHGGATPEAAAVIDDWVQEQGRTLLGDRLFQLFELGGLPLEFEANAIVAATVANLTTPAKSLRHTRDVYQAPHTLEDLLARPLAHRLRSLTLLEREPGELEPGVGFMPNALGLAVGIAARAPAAATLERLDCASFDRPAEGRLDLGEQLSAFPSLKALRAVFSQGVRVPSSEALTRLEVGWLSAATQVRELIDGPWPNLQQLGLGIRSKVRLSRPMRERLLDRERLPRLTTLAFHAEPNDFSLEQDPAVATQEREVFDALLEGGLLPALKVLHWGPGLHAGDVHANAQAFAHLDSFELLLTDGDEAEGVEQVLPRARVLNGPPA